MPEKCRLRITDRGQSVVSTVVALCLLLATPVRVEACRACFPFPKKTVADFLTESEFVVLGRENQTQPFTYSTVAILKGETAPNNIDLFVDSTTRRILKSNPGHAVVLVRKSDRDPWQSLGIADDKYQEVVKRIVAHSESWKGEKVSNQRYKFFLPLLGHSNLSLHELAYLELGRAPYGTIKKMANFVSSDDLRPMLHRREYFEWRPLAILMLAQNPGKEDRKLITSSFESCQKFSLTTNLAAWATAFIELNGSDALDEIEENYLRNSDRSAAEIRAVIIALSIHGRSGHTHLRDRVVESYGVALQNHPQVAGLIVNDLTDWNKHEHRVRIMKIIKNSRFEFDALETKSIKSYLGKSGTADSR